MQTSIRTWLMTMACLTGLLLVPLGHAEELTRGAMLSASCEGCHGTHGRSPGAIPDISGKSAEFIRVSLEDFRSGVRASTVMARHAKGYTEDEIRLIAEYFAKHN